MLYNLRRKVYLAHGSAGYTRSRASSTSGEEFRKLPLKRKKRRAEITWKERKNKREEGGATFF